MIHMGQTICANGVRMENKKMATYRATVRFEVLDFEAESIEQANLIIDELVNELGAIDTKLSWDSVDWEVI